MNFLRFVRRQASRQAGFRLIQRTTVIELVRDADRVAGLIATTPTAG